VISQDQNSGSEKYDDYEYKGNLDKYRKKDEPKIP
jgi:hypothetical protein